MNFWYKINLGVGKEKESCSIHWSSNALLRMGDSCWASAAHHVMWSRSLLQALAASIYITYQRKEEESIVDNNKLLRKFWVKWQIISNIGDTFMSDRARHSPAPFHETFLSLVVSFNNFLVVLTAVARIEEYRWSDNQCNLISLSMRVRCNSNLTKWHARQFNQADSFKLEQTGYIHIRVLWHLFNTLQWGWHAMS